MPIEVPSEARYRRFEVNTCVHEAGLNVHRWLQVDDQIVLDVASEFDDQAAIVKDNLKDVKLARGETGQEFMVAFTVDGAP